MRRGARRRRMNGTGGIRCLLDAQLTRFNASGTNGRLAYCGPVPRWRTNADSKLCASSNRWDGQTAAIGCPPVSPVSANTSEPESDPSTDNLSDRRVSGTESAVTHMLRHMSRIRSAHARMPHSQPLPKYLRLPARSEQEGKLHSASRSTCRPPQNSNSEPEPRSGRHTLPLPARQRAHARMCGTLMHKNRRSRTSTPIRARRKHRSHDCVCTEEAHTYKEARSEHHNPFRRLILRVVVHALPRLHRSHVESAITQSHVQSASSHSTPRAQERWPHTSQPGTSFMISFSRSSAAS